MITSNQIIRVTPIPEYFNLTWMLGSRCNYDCMYCPADLHDSTSKPHDLETMQQVWRNIYNKTKHKNLSYKINFTGGEVTANRNFLPLVSWLRTTYPEISMILLTTNGSASRRYYEQLSALIESISFSTHSEFMNEQEFFNKVLAINKIMVRPIKSVHVNIMDEHWNQDRIELYKTYLDQHQISYSVNCINYEHSVRTNILNKGNTNLVVT
jgi:MoaA/NifB/PqqE/SkfB family radical SAM enzyme